MVELSFYLILVLHFCWHCYSEDKRLEKVVAKLKQHYINHEKQKAKWYN